MGPKLSLVFEQQGISTVRDLFHFFPRRYEDRTQIQKVSEVSEGVTVTLNLRVINVRKIFVPRMRKNILEARCEDSTGVLHLKWFHAPWGLDKKLIPGASLLATGKVKFYQKFPEIYHPEISWGAVSEESESTSDIHSGRIVPVYVEIDGVSSRVLRKVLWEALESFKGSLVEEVPPYLLNRRGLPQAQSALRSLHFPSENLETLELTHARNRFAYEELLKFEFVILKKKRSLEKLLGVPLLSCGRKAAEAYQASLPFQLTSGQRACLEEIIEDLALSHPMNRLLQGEVGSGKTIVALLSVSAVLGQGGQAALMAPTEILAVQHLFTVRKLLGNSFPVELLSGRTSALERVRIFKRLSSGEALLLIGTHALIEKPVVFANLNYVIIDEQHRFGVEQRRTLMDKGRRALIPSKELIHPHLLLLSATPIPRTLALSALGDLSVSSLTELPPGRSPVKTQVVRSKQQKASVHDQIQNQLSSGQQAYFIYPLINESKAEGFTHLKSAVEQAVLLSKDVFPSASVGILHGQLSSEEKNQVMVDFKTGVVQVLVSTTVVEVGVDVPNATVMVIEHAERFGLSQLHQLRGRVGRGSHASYCYLFTDSKLNDRLEVLEETQDGFKIAEADLELRGPGEFLGTRQAGELPFKLANLVQDRVLLLQAREDAEEILDQDPELKLEQNRGLAHYFSREGNLKLARFGTA